MKLREAIRTIVREVVGEDLRRIVREVLVEELMDAEEAPNPRSVAAKKAAATRAANKARAKGSPKQEPRLPQAARELGLALHQRWKGKDYVKVKDRVIEIQSIDAKGVVPRIVSSPDGKRTNAKHITFAHLRHSYSKVE